MKWVKLGQVFTANGQRPWMQTHAANPVAEPLGGDTYRIYFGCRDRQQRSHIGFVDIDLNRPTEVLRIAEEPVVAPGPVGGFDDSGTSMACLVPAGAATYLYYIGWNLGVTVPWRNFIGLAVRLAPDRPFVKYSPAPIVDRSAIDPYSVSYPWVIRDGSRWKMWYGSNLSWGQDHADMNHVIKYAESADGIHWERTGVIALDLELPEIFAVCRPCVVKEDGRYRMWYCYRGRTYRMGYAESADGIHWVKRPDLVGIEASPSGWDGEMAAYPSVFQHAGRRYMLYCGNRYGLAGFGLAVAEAAGAAPTNFQGAAA